MNTTNIESLRDVIERDGFAVLPGALSTGRVDDVRRDVCRALECRTASEGALRGGDQLQAARNLLGSWPAVAELARTPLLFGAITNLLSPDCGLVRALFFDKPPGRSWALPWHKDMTISVQRNDLPSSLFRKPTTKAGVPHVEAPESVLERMLTARLHLDETIDENGPLLVIPGSHRSGKAPVAPAGNVQLRPIHVAAGDVLLMRPLLCHSSGYAAETTKRHRRVIHLEFAERALPDGYEWHDFVQLNEV